MYRVIGVYRYIGYIAVFGVSVYRCMMYGVLVCMVYWCRGGVVVWWSGGIVVWRCGGVCRLQHARPLSRVGGFF